MKKAFAVFCSIVIACGMSVTAFADGAKNDKITSVGAEGNSSTNDVDVIIDGTENLETVYSVTVDWESLDFTYTYDEGAVWNPDTHTYSENTAGGWDKTSANVKVTNHSNDDVSIAATMNSYTQNGVTAAISNGTFDLATGEGLTYESAANNSFGVSVTGTPTTDTSFTIGTVTVAISAK